MGVFIITIVILLAADQLFKYLSIGLGNTVKDIGLMYIGYVENHGFIKEVWWNVILIIISILLICAFVKFFFNKYAKEVKTQYNSLPFILVIAGGVSNVIDRIARQFVVDYMSFKHLMVGTWFNLADVYIVIGAIMLFAIYAIKLTDTTVQNMTEGELNARNQSGKIYFQNFKKKFTDKFGKKQKSKKNR